MEPKPLERKLTAILFADVASRLTLPAALLECVAIDGGNPKVGQIR